MKQCLNCGKQLEDNAAFCNGCGTPVVQTEETKVCPGCGKTVKANASFCMQCGHSFSNVKKERKCEVCGAVLTSEAGPCPSCGHVPGTPYGQPMAFQPGAFQQPMAFQAMPVFPKPDPGCIRLSRVWKALAFFVWIFGLIGTIVVTVETSEYSYWGGQPAYFVFLYNFIMVGLVGLAFLSLGIFFRVLGEKNKK